VLPLPPFHIRRIGFFWSSGLFELKIADLRFPLFSVFLRESLNFPGGPGFLTLLSSLLCVVLLVEEYLWKRPTFPRFHSLLFPPFYSFVCPIHGPITMFNLGRVRSAPTGFWPPAPCEDHPSPPSPPPAPPTFYGFLMSENPPF